MWGLEEWEGVEGRDGGEISGGFVEDLFYRDFEGVDDGFDFSVSVVDGGFGAEVQFHVLLK